MFASFRSVAYLLAVIVAASVAFALFFQGKKKEEAKEVEFFLKEVVYHHHFGYTLFGDKPVSIAAYFAQEPFGNLLSRRQTRFNLGSSWKKWKKYQKSLQIRNYLFLHEMDVDVEGIHVISLINKKAFLAKVEEHIDLFRSILGKDITPTSLLETASKPHASLFKILKYNEGLYGILLGFGENNAFAFKRYLELAKLIDPLYRDFPTRFSPLLPQPSHAFASLYEEYEYLRSHLRLFPGKKDLSLIAFPCMTALEHDHETTLLEQKYHEERQKIVTAYSEGDFLKVTLKQLCATPKI